MRIEVERIVVSGLAEPLAAADFASDLRHELGRALRDVRPGASRALTAVEAELGSGEQAAGAIAGALQKALGGAS